MSTRTPDPHARSRAEARRRQRLAARGEIVEDEEPTNAEPAEAPRGNILTRIFPPAPPLPNKPDPLAGFDRTAPLRPIRERLFLLRQNPVAWVVPGIVSFLGFYASIFYADGGLGLAATFLLFGAIIAAGWFGWQRPTLYGTTAAILGYLISAAIIIGSFAFGGVPPETFGASAFTAIGTVLIQGLYPAFIGFLGGWYGGYLRRRQTQLSADTRRRR
ncbi:MAG TPA: hypothetical protein VF367_05340 [Candidatus Limnocylindria bacterium]|jgi:hypothetical protein